MRSVTCAIGLAALALLLVSLLPALSVWPSGASAVLAADPATPATRPVLAVPVAPARAFASSGGPAVEESVPR